MAKFTVKAMEKSELFKTSGGETITLTFRPLSRIDKMGVAAALSRGDLADAERQMLEGCVRGWSGVRDETDQDVPFSQASLDNVLGVDDVVGVAVHDRLLVLNGLAEGKEPPLDPTAGDASKSSTTAAS